MNIFKIFGLFGIFYMNICGGNSLKKIIYLLINSNTNYKPLRTYS